MARSQLALRTEPSLGEEDGLENARQFWEVHAGQSISQEEAREAIQNASAFATILAEWARLRTTVR